MEINGTKGPIVVDIGYDVLLQYHFIHELLYMNVTLTIQTCAPGPMHQVQGLCY